MRVLYGFACAWLGATTFAQSPAPLPPNYRVILDTSDVLVQRVHYGPHEFVPMHDHPPATTVYVYLNDSGVVDITHEGPGGSVVHRPPTHTGAFRISPGNFERHSVQNTSDLPSDFLRIELKHLPSGSVTGEFRSASPVDQLSPGRMTAFSAPGILIERLFCPAAGDCPQAPLGRIAYLVPIPTHQPTPAESEATFKAEENNDVIVEPATKGWNFKGDGHTPYQILRISFPPNR